jgi:hypothetical protein
MHPAPGVPRGTTQTRSHPGSEPDGHPRHVPRGTPPSDSGVSLCFRTPSTRALPSRGCQDLPDTFHVEHGEPQSALPQRSALGRSTWNTLRPRSPSAPGTNHLRPPHPEGRGECPSDTFHVEHLPAREPVRGGNARHPEPDTFHVERGPQPNSTGRNRSTWNTRAWASAHPKRRRCASRYRRCSNRTRESIPAGAPRPGEYSSRQRSPSSRKDTFASNTFSEHRSKSDQKRRLKALHPVRPRLRFLSTATTGRDAFPLERGWTFSCFFMVELAPVFGALLRATGGEGAASFFGALASAILGCLRVLATARALRLVWGFSQLSAFVFMANSFPARLAPTKRRGGSTRQPRTLGSAWSELESQVCGKACRTRRAPVCRSADAALHGVSSNRRTPRSAHWSPLYRV